MKFNFSTCKILYYLLLIRFISVLFSETKIKVEILKYFVVLMQSKHIYLFFV